MANKSVCSMQKKKEALAKKSEATYNPDKVKADEMRLDYLSGVDDFYDGVKKYGFDIKDRGYYGSGKDGVYYRTIWLMDGKRKSGPNTNHTIKIGYDTNENTPFVAIDQYVLGSVKDLLTVIDDNFAPKTMEALAKTSEAKKSEAKFINLLDDEELTKSIEGIYRDAWKECCDSADEKEKPYYEGSEWYIEEFAPMTAESTQKSMYDYVASGKYSMPGNFKQIDLDWDHDHEGGIKFSDLKKKLLAGTQDKDTEEFSHWGIDWFFDAFGTFGLEYNFKDALTDSVYYDMREDGVVESKKQEAPAKKSEAKKSEGVYGTIRVDSENIAIKVQESNVYPSSSGRSLSVEVPKVEAWFSTLSEFSDCIDGMAEDCNGYPDISRDGSDILVQINAPMEDENGEFNGDYEVIAELRCSTEITSTSLEGVVDLLNHD